MIVNSSQNVEPLFMLKSIFRMKLYGCIIDNVYPKFIIVSDAISSTPTAAPSAVPSDTSPSFTDYSSATASIGPLNSFECYCIINGCIRIFYYILCFYKLQELKRRSWTLAPCSSAYRCLFSWRPNSQLSSSSLVTLTSFHPYALVFLRLYWLHQTRL